MNVENPTKEDLENEIKKLQEENRLKTHWISLITHDSKEIFGTLIWLLEALDAGDISQDVFLSMLPEIKAGAVKNLKTVTDTTEWIKTQYGNFIPKRELLSACELFQNLQKQARKKLDEKHLQFCFRGDSGLSFCSDPVLASFVLNKVLENAIQFSFTKGVIEFEAEQLDEEAKISIVDQGQGIPSKFLDKVFSFEGPKFEGTAGEKGAGLSLKIVKEFVRLIDAKIEIQSTEKGTEVTLLFPLKKF